MTGLESAFLLNPRRKARRRKGRGRRRRVRARRRRRGNARGWFRKRAKGSIRRRFRGGVRYTHPKKKTRKKSRRARRGNPHHYTVNPRRRRRRKHSSRRRRNPRGGGGGKGLVGMLKMPEILPFRVPLPGIAGTIATNVVQGLAAGTIFMGGYLLSGALVNFLVTAEEADAEPDTFKGKWARPLLFAATAGLIGGLTAFLAPKGKKPFFAILGAAGPGIRALGGVLKAVMDKPTAPGITADAYNLAVGLADYIQVGDNEAPYSYAGTDDYIQVEDLYEAGLGQEEEVPEYEYEEESFEPEVEDLYEAGLGLEEEVVGI